MKTLSIFTMCAVGCLVTAEASAQVAAPASQFKQFQSFMDHAQSAPAADFVGRDGNKVRDTAALEEMRKHILQMYSNMPVINSFEHDGQAFDCVPVMQQPSVRLRGGKPIASPPSAVAGPSLGMSDATRPQIPAMSFDAHGNLKSCTSGNVPIRRVTLEETSRFETLDHFFQKGPDGTGQAKTPGDKPPIGGKHTHGDWSPGSEEQLPCAAASDGKCHAHAYGYQNVTNYGVSSTFELWNPSVSPWQVFSLSQLWIVNTAGPKGTQTVESGWQVFPTKYNTSNAVLFIFSTPDGYKTGCYNHDCPNFVQVNNSITLGAGFSSYSSVQNGTKYMATMRLSWWLYQGNWWLGYGSTWVGYYPGTMYDVGTGTTLHSSANQIQFGGEAVGGYQFFSYNPLVFLPTFPQMGSGYLSNSFFAAQQSSIYYLTNTAASSAWSKLTAASDTIASCYTSTISGTTLIFGGGGGYQYC